MSKNSTSNIFLNKYWRLLLTGIIIGVLLIGYFYVIRMDFNNWRTLKTRALIELNNQITQSQMELTKLAAIQDSYNALAAEQQANLAQLSQILPTAADIPQLVVQLEGLARQSGFALSGVEFSSSQALAGSSDQHLKALNIKANLSGPGDYQNLKGLLANIEQHIRLLDLLSLSLSSQQQLSQATDQGYSFELRTYYWEP